MVNLSHDRCCGCGSCAAICPKDAVAMQEDNHGFVYPVIDESKCIGCGLCDRHCPELSSLELSEPQAVYAACSNDRHELSTCASGGAATIFGRHIIRQGGVVYGCSQKNYRTIQHIRVDKVDGLEKLKGSKYVQSDMGSIYLDVKKDLAAGIPVLFIGTPCQVGALRSYLHRPYENLMAIDLVCHGVPSQGMLRNAVESSVPPSENISVNFRWKTQYGIQYGIQFGIQFGIHNQIVKSITAPQSAYMTAFLSRLSYRENCHNCRYAQQARVGDITVGDFWGLGKEAPSSINDKRGVSLIMVNSSRGKKLWDAACDSFVSEIRTIGEAVKYNWNLHDPSPRPANKDKFLEIYASKGMEQAVRNCVRRYRIESMGIVRYIRRTPILNQMVGIGIRAIRKIL